jgi:hypothetical protein
LSRLRAALLTIAALAIGTPSAHAGYLQVEFGHDYGTLSDQHIALDFYDTVETWVHDIFPGVDVVADLLGEVRSRVTNAGTGQSIYSLRPFRVRLLSYAPGSSTPIEIFRGQARPVSFIVYDADEYGDSVDFTGRGKLRSDVARALGVNRKVSLDGMFLTDIVRGQPGTERSVSSACCQYVGVTTAPVPEPASVGLLVAGVALGLARVVRQRRRKQRP